MAILLTKRNPFSKLKFRRWWCLTYHKEKLEMAILISLGIVRTRKRMLGLDLVAYYSKLK